MSQTFAIGIGGAAGQGCCDTRRYFGATLQPRGLHLNAYNAYQSIIRGGHTFLTIRTGVDEVRSMGDSIDLLIPLNQDTMDRHLRLLTAGGACIYNGDTIKPGPAADGVQLCPLPVSTLADITRNKVAQNTLALGASLSMMGVGFNVLEGVFQAQFGKKGEAVVNENVSIARAGYEYATANFKPFDRPLPMTENRYAVLSGNAALAMGGARCRVQILLCLSNEPFNRSAALDGVSWAYGGHHGAPGRGRDWRYHMAIGAAHGGVRSMCATSGGGFALMTEGLGLSAMAEIPVVAINCMRAGPSTGVPTKTEQGDLWQALGAAFGDFPRVIAAPLDIGDCFTLMPEIFNLTDKFQCPGIVLCDLLLSEGRLSVEPSLLNFNPPIDRGELITSNGDVHDEYLRYKITESGISPRAIPGIPGFMHVVSSDEHDENGVLISDEYTNHAKRRAMMEKRQRKVKGIEAAVLPPVLDGPANADVTLIGWGSTDGTIREARAMLAEQGITSNQLQIRWIVPLHGDAIVEILGKAKHTIIVENNLTGQFARYLRSETSFVADGHIRKYDGEPFMPHHIVEAVREQLTGTTTLSVPTHEVMV